MAPNHPWAARTVRSMWPRMSACALTIGLWSSSSAAAAAAAFGDAASSSASRASPSFFRAASM